MCFSWLRSTGFLRLTVLVTKSVFFLVGDGRGLVSKFLFLLIKS